MAPFIEVKASGPDIPEGVYPVVLTDIRGPKTVTAQRGPNAGQDIELFDWIFAIESGPHENIEISASSSMASGPRSKMYAFLTALYGGKRPTIGTAFEKAEIVGRSALATIQKDDDGWLRITTLSAQPAGFNPVTDPVPTAGADTVTQDDAQAAAAQPLRDKIAAGDAPF